MKNEILYGIHPVCEALNAGRREIRQIFIANSRNRRLEDLRAKAGRLKIPVETVDREKMDALTEGAQHQGAAARAARLPLWDLSSFLRSPKLNPQPFFLILDQITDPHNAGALIRTALCTGADAVLVPKDRSVSPTPAVSRISAGALEHLPWIQGVNLANNLKQLKKEGIWIAGLDREGDTSLFGSDLSGPLGMVIGGEEKGIRPLIRTFCDLMIAIPQKGPLDSLNASVAGAAVMYEAFRQRETV